MTTITLESNVIHDKFTDYVCNSYDIKQDAKSIERVQCPNLSSLDDFEWSIGLVYGGSGSGKTTILKQFGSIQDCRFDPSKALISNFDFLEPNEATKVLTSVGLSSVPTWLRPFQVLSNGEQYRAKLAYIIAKANDGDVILIDEFTSVVDRDVAKAMSFALQKFIRRTKKKIVLASCHYDIIEWLNPDWVYSPQKGGAVERREWRRQLRPKIELQVNRVEYSAWELFKKHHYLTEYVNKGCKFFLFEWLSKPIGIVAITANPSGTVKNSYRISRTVVLPDYQGLGIGSKISEFVASIVDGRVFTKTVNPALGEYRNKSICWKPTSKHLKELRGQHKEKGENIWTTKTRASYCHEYIGEKVDGYGDLLLPIEIMRKNNSKQIEMVF